MSDSEMYVAMREFIRIAVENEVRKALPKEVRSPTSPPELNYEDIERRVWERIEPKIPKPPTFTQPENGKDGRGIDDLSIREGSLVARFTDKTEQNLGRVVGRDAEPAKDGKDATGIAEVSKRNGELVIRLTDNTERNLGRVEPKDGENGADGIPTIEDVEAVVERRVADINVRTFADTYKGVYKPGELYTRGVLTTWGGSLWLSLADTKNKPGENGDWKLVVKK